ARPTRPCRRMVSTGPRSCAAVQVPLNSISQPTSGWAAPHSATSWNVGTAAPANAGPNQLPASAAPSAPDGVAATSASIPAVRSAVASCMITGTPSAASRTSISIRSLPGATAASKAAIVFSGADDESPRCAMVRMWPGWGRRDSGSRSLGTALDVACNVLLVRCLDFGSSGGKCSSGVLVLQNDLLDRCGEVLIAGWDERPGPVLHTRRRELVDGRTGLRRLGEHARHLRAFDRRGAHGHVAGARG